MRDILDEALGRLHQVAGVRGAVIVDLQAGVPVAVKAGADLDPDALAALATLFFDRLTRAAGVAAFGAVAALHLEGAAGHLLVASGGDLLIVVIAEAGAQLEVLRLEARRMAEELR
jgi:predicted regulator of Ras-like GTPase activity (Roadblock/LC7/MglB family)